MQWVPTSRPGLYLTFIAERGIVIVQLACSILFTLLSVYLSSFL